jgi:hypothetical protein
LRIHPYFLRGRGKILHRERRKKINKCNKSSLFDKNPPSFSNPRINTVRDIVVGYEDFIK